LTVRGFVYMALLYYNISEILKADSDRIYSFINN
jgi:hypothetical protein